MRPDLVVLTPELLDRDLRIDSVSEPLHAQALIAKLAVERLIVAVLPGLARIDMCRVDVRLQESSGDTTVCELKLCTWPSWSAITCEMIVGWRVSCRMITELVLDALEQALQASRTGNGTVDSLHQTTGRGLR